MPFITFESPSSYDKNYQVNLLEEVLVKQRISSSVINMNNKLFDDNISRLYKHLDDEASVSPSEKFFLQLARRSRQLEHLFRFTISRQFDLAYSIILCPHSESSLKASYATYKAQQLEKTFNTKLNMISDVYTALMHGPQFEDKVFRDTFEMAENLYEPMLPNRLHFYIDKKDKTHSKYNEFLKNLTPYKEYQGNNQIVVCSINGDQEPQKVHQDIHNIVIKHFKKL